eukprot:92516_1
MASTHNELTKLSDPPINSNDPILISHILTFNDTELLVIVCNDKLTWQLKELWIYNICNDSYTELMSEKSVNEIIIYYTASLNDNKSFLYLFDHYGNIIKLNLKT